MKMRESGHWNGPEEETGQPASDTPRPEALDEYSTVFEYRPFQSPA